MKTGVITNPYGSQLTGGTSGGAAPAIDANHLYVYTCSEASGSTTFANSGSGINGTLTLGGTEGTDYYLGSKIMGRNLTSFRNLKAGAAGSGGAVSGNTCSVAGGSFSIEAFILPNDVKVSGAADPGGTVIGVYGGSDLLLISTPYFSTGFYSDCIVSGHGSVSTGSAVIKENSMPAHIMATYNGANGTNTLYVNGIVAGTNTFSTSAPFSTITKIYVGNDNASYGCFQGWIAQVRVSNTVRSAAYALATTETLFAM